MKKLIITFVLLVSSILCARAEYTHGYILSCGITIYETFPSEPSSTVLLQRHDELEDEYCNKQSGGGEIQIPDKDDDIHNP